MIPQAQKKTRQRSTALEEETPQVRKAIKDRSREPQVEIIPQMARSRSRAMGEEDTPQMTVVQRAVQLFQKGGQQKRNEIEQIVPHLGDALMRAKAKLLTKQAGEGKASIVAPRSISDIITEIESKGMPTDLSPRLRKPIKLQMEAFRSRPVSTFGPARRTQRRS